MSTILKNQATLQEVEDFIIVCGNTNPTMLVGQPGVGKTAMFDRIVERTGFRGVYMNVPELDLGDIGIPMPNHENKTTTLYPSEAWGFHTGEPLVIFMDEFSKGAEPVKNVLHPLINERRIGPFKSHPDTIVVITGNFSTDGVGDILKAHSINRMTVVPIKNPTSEEWRAWGAQDNRVCPEVLAWAKAYEHAFASYLDDDQAENEFIFNPKRPDEPFCSPRSLHKASNIIRNRDRMTQNMLKVALAGTVGKATAASMASYIQVADTLPTWEEIMANPQHAKLPESPAAQCILAYSALMKVDRQTITKWFEYMKRASTELQSVFCISGTKSPKRDLLMSSKAFVDWATEKQYLF